MKPSVELAKPRLRHRGSRSPAGPRSGWPRLRSPTTRYLPHWHDSVPCKSRPRKQGGVLAGSGSPTLIFVPACLRVQLPRGRFGLQWRACTPWHTAQNGPADARRNGREHPRVDDQPREWGLRDNIDVPLAILPIASDAGVCGPIVNAVSESRHKRCQRCASPSRTGLGGSSHCPGSLWRSEHRGRNTGQIRNK